MGYYEAEWNDEKQAWYVWDYKNDRVYKWCCDKDEAYDLANRLNDGRGDSRGCYGR